MRHGQTSRNYAKAFFAFVTIGLVSACSDSSLAPTTSEAAFKAPAAFSKTLGVKIFRVNNREGTTQRIGSHVINIPAGAICALNSSYGFGQWDKSCTPLNGSVVIVATMLEDNDGHPYVDFQPSMRFVPTKEVMLFLKNGKSAQATELGVKWCNNLGVCVDESLTDASLKPFRVGKSSMIGFRVKHFSGYQIAVGKGCQGELTDDGEGGWVCEESNPSTPRRSGYMVASGLTEGSETTPDSVSVGRRGRNEH